jgi:hypothetical protein
MKKNGIPSLIILSLILLSFTFCSQEKNVKVSSLIDMKNTVVVVPSGNSEAERIAAVVLTEEVEKRTGLQWKIVTESPEKGHAVFLSSNNQLKSERIKPEGYHLKIDEENGKIEILISGADGRGVLYGVGKLLRIMEWKNGEVNFPEDIDITSSPAYPMRGHQIAYRTLANSYDAWTPEIYDQYIRDLALFGTNSIELIPNGGRGPLMKYDPLEMNIAVSEICDKYDMDFWFMTGVEMDLSDAAKRDEVVARHKKEFNAMPRLDGVFFSGGDPGISHPKYVLPLLEDLATALKQKHPEAKVWFSLQEFDEEEVDYFFDYINREMPEWFGGLVNGPHSPNMVESRKRLPAKYRLRHYPDITHSCRGQFPVEWWDSALARTLGRECPNPQPVYNSLIHNWFAPYTDGFISYSDGMHDDLNKFIWSAKSWNPDIDVREILKDYSRFFFRPDLAESATDGILALEKNWVGALVENGSVETTLKYWEGLANEAPELENNWRWQLFQLRSKYDAYIRNRVIYERELEEQVNNILSEAVEIGADSAMSRSLKILNLAVTEPVSPELRNEIEASALVLFNTIGLQTSVEKYKAYGLNRGAIIDYLDMPMNNRFWLEDEFAKVQKLLTEVEKLNQLDIIRNWENPGEGSFYDDLGTLDRSTHLVTGEGLQTNPTMSRNPQPGFWYWNEGFNRLRLSWLVSMDGPIAMVYEGIDTNADYDVRVTGYRIDKIQINGEWVKPFVFSAEKGAVVEYHVPAKAVKSGKITLNWGDPELTEVWLIKR